MGCHPSHLLIFFRGVAKNHQAVNSVQNPGWLIISSGILLANILGIMKIQEREIPFLTNQYNGKTKGFWTLLIENTKMV